MRQENDHYKSSKANLQEPSSDGDINILPISDTESGHLVSKTSTSSEEDTNTATAGA
jgi:hypothetical protein